MTYSELEAHDIQAVEEWFQKHKATVETTEFSPGDPITKVTWKQPGTSNCMIVYLLYHGWLTVMGDLGDAVYLWNHTLTLGWLADLNLGYFGGKCLASSEEPKGKTWDERHARIFIEYELQQWATDNPKDCPTCTAPGYQEQFDEDDDVLACPTCKGEETVPRPPLTFEKCAELTYEEDGERLEEIISNHHAWATWMYEGNGLILSDQKEKVEPDYLGRGRVLLEDKEAYPRRRFEESYDAGYTWDLRTRAHLMGLKMAWKQLNPPVAPAEETKIECKQSPSPS